LNNSKVIAITGTSRGIGLGIAKHFLSQGYIVIGCGRSEVKHNFENYHYSKVDITDEQQVRIWIKSIQKEYNRLDVLVCNAGEVKSSLLMTVTPTNVLSSFMETHIKGTFITCREASKIMIRQKRGRIITISSLSVPLLLEGTSAYTATKSAIVDMTKVFAKELAPIGITCNVISPGLIETDVTKNFSNEWKNMLIAKQTIQSTFEIEELCYIIKFFIDRKSDCITGQVINMGLVT
jgi:3-oxoacyl-[acyl-carrier protein] reductase